MDQDSSRSNLPGPPRPPPNNYLPLFFLLALLFALAWSSFVLMKNKDPGALSAPVSSAPDSSTVPAPATSTAPYSSTITYHQEERPPAGPEPMTGDPSGPRDFCEVKIGDIGGGYLNQTLTACASICHDKSLLLSDRNSSAFGKKLTCRWKGEDVAPAQAPAGYPVDVTRACDVKKMEGFDATTFGTGTATFGRCQQMCDELLAREPSEEWFCTWDGKEFARHNKRERKTPFQQTGKCEAPWLLPNISTHSIARVDKRQGQLLDTNEPVTWRLEGAPAWALLSGKHIQFGDPKQVGIYKFKAIGTNDCGKSVEVPLTVELR